MNAESFFGLDPNGIAVIAMCVVVSFTLGILIVGGFAALWRARRHANRLAGLAGQVSHELGLADIWRMKRAVRGIPGSASDGSSEPGWGPTVTIERDRQLVSGDKH